MKITVPLREQEINDLTDGPETDNVATKGLANLYARIVPHYDWCKSIKMGAIKVNQKTAEYIIGRLSKMDLTKDQVCLLWLNQGFSTVSEGIEDWKVQIDFDRLDYTEMER